MTSAKPDLPIIAFPSQEAWDAWLADQPATSPGLWLKFAKKGAGLPSVTKAEAIETALRHGWIDGQLDRLDDKWWLTRFTPRGPRSKWSRINRATALKLIEAGRMTQAGLREVERAKADGRWDAAYESQGTASVPDDLRDALDANESAKAFFATLDSANRYAILHRIQDAKKPETRARRIATYVAMLGEHKTIHP
jgi:uncharacterized protein YdeI (YjbR/CyaY-like superfamily)